MPVATPTVDVVFRALSDPTRRQVLEQLARGPATVSDLARPFSMALPSFTQHLRVLETARLVRSRKRGRIRTYRLEPASLDVAENWLAQRRAHWERRLDQLDQFLESRKKEQP